MVDSRTLTDTAMSGSLFIYGWIELRDLRISVASANKVSLFIVFIEDGVLIFDGR